MTTRTVLDVNPLASVDVPVLAGPQRQGDILIVPRAPLGRAEIDGMTPIPTEGLSVVRSDVTGNEHVLLADGPGVTFRRHDTSDPNDVLLGVLDVPAGSQAWIVHTDEHGANGIAAGCYTIHGKREQADIVRRVAD